MRLGENGARMNKYLNNRNDIIKRINEFSFENYIKKYPNWKKKIGNTDTYFVMKNGAEYLFAPVKYIMSVSEENHENTNGGEARNTALGLGFMLVEGNVKKEHKLWCEKKGVTYKVQNRILAPVEVSGVQNIIEEYCLVEEKLKNSFIINGNKSLQGELGEWLVRVIFGASPLQVNSKGADLITADGKKVEVKTKRPHQSNNNGISVGKAKVDENSEESADYLAFIWFSEKFKIESFTVVTKEQFLSQLGVRDAYILKPQEVFPEETITFKDRNKNVSWKNMIKNEQLLLSWLI